MGWSLEGSYFESCSCFTPCPCTVSLALGADHDYCRVVLAFNITSGDVNGTDVGGVGVAMIADTPKVMSDGGWRVGLWIDDGAPDEQADAIGQVFSGALGGPPALLAPLLGEFLGIQRAPIAFEEDGLSHAVKIGDAVDIEVEDVVPVGVETGQPARLTGIFHPAGDTLTVSKARRATVDGFGISFEGSSGFSTPRFAWAG